MGTLLNRRRYMGASKQEKVLFEMYNQYFDGTVNSVVDTGLKLWDGTYNRWKMEVVYDAITDQYTNQTTLFSVRPDVKPYNGIRVRKDRAFNNDSDFTLTVGEVCTVISNPGEFSFGTNTYGSHLYIVNTNSVNSLTLIRDGQYLYCDYNGQTATLKITDPKTNNLNLLIGCDYKGANNETQRYYTGTIQKFVIKELPSADEVIMTSITNPEVLAVCYAQGWCADANYMTKREAEAVTDIGTAFQSNTSITHFEELQYFSAMTSLVANAFNGCTALSSLVLPTSVTSLGSNCFVGCPFEELDLSHITSLGSQFIFNNCGIKYPWFPLLTRHGTASGNSSAFITCAHLGGIRLDSIIYLGSFVYNYTGDVYLVVTTQSVPNSTNPARWPVTIYVRDELIASYQAATNWNQKTIKGISQLPTDDPNCPWISDLREKGLII